MTDSDDLERLVLAHTPRFRRLLEAAERRITETGGVAHDEFWARLAKPAPTRVAERESTYSTAKARKEPQKPTVRKRRGGRAAG